MIVNINQRYYMLSKGEVGWIGISQDGPVNGRVSIVSPLGHGNMTSTGEYDLSELVEITKEEYMSIATPQQAWIFDDEDGKQEEYEEKLDVVLKRYGLA
jgi:hypothetical protein